MEGSIANYVLKILENEEIGKPIYTKQISQNISMDYNITLSKASSTVSNSIKRIMDSKAIPELRSYQSGIYYRCKETVFGETTIDTEQLIMDKYLYDDNGYETGNYLLHKLGLTTQISKERIIATNFSKDCSRKDKKLDITIRPAKTYITSKNKNYLQILDAIDLLDTSPIDSDDPYFLMGKHINNLHLDYEDLLALANRYYNQKTILSLAKIAAKRSTL